jgi:aspartokinase/homoserine dehydrogenase 1
LAEANKKESRLKFVAQFENGKPALVYNSSQRPSFYNLEGKDNIVLFFTDRYVDQPLLIKAGAGLRLPPLEFC